MSQELDLRLFVAIKNRKNAQFTYPGQRLNSHSPESQYHTDQGMRRRKNTPGKLDKRKPLGVIKLILRGCTD